MNTDHNTEIRNYAKYFLFCSIIYLFYLKKLVPIYYLEVLHIIIAVYLAWKGHEEEEEFMYTYKVLQILDLISKRLTPKWQTI